MPPRRRRRPNPTFDVYGLRMALGLSQVELAAKIPCSWRTVLRWEMHGNTPHPAALKQLRLLHAEKYGPPPTTRPAQTAPRPSSGAITNPLAMPPGGF